MSEGGGRGMKRGSGEAEKTMRERGKTVSAVDQTWERNKRRDKERKKTEKNHEWDRRGYKMIILAHFNQF